MNAPTREEHDLVLKELADARIDRDNALQLLDKTESAARHLLGVVRGDISGRKRGAPRRSVIAPQPRPLPDGGGL